MKYVSLVLVFLLLASVEAIAGSNSISCSPLNFGNYILGQTLTVSSTMSVSLESPGQAYTLSIDPGQYSSGGFNRRMNSGSNYISYNIYSDSTCTQILGDGSSGTSVITGNTTAIYTVYGEVTGNQNVPAGTYSDNLFITLSF